MDNLSVGKLRELIKDLPDTALISPAWANGPPGDMEPAVVLHGFRVADGELVALVSLQYLDEFEGEEEEDEVDEFEGEEEEDEVDVEGTGCGDYDFPADE